MQLHVKVINLATASMTMLTTLLLYDLHLAAGLPINRQPWTAAPEPSIRPRVTAEIPSEAQRETTGRDVTGAAPAAAALAEILKTDNLVAAADGANNRLRVRNRSTDADFKDVKAIKRLLLRLRDGNRSSSTEPSSASGLPARGRRRPARHPRAVVVPYSSDVVEVMPDTKAYVDQYFNWRHSHHGYGRLYRRWGRR